MSWVDNLLNRFSASEITRSRVISMFDAGSTFGTYFKPTTDNAGLVFRDLRLAERRVVFLDFFLIAAIVLIFTEAELLTECHKTDTVCTGFPFGFRVTDHALNHLVGYPLWGCAPDFGGIA